MLKYRNWAEISVWSAFSLIVLFYLILKSYSFHWQTGDENIYFYMAWVTQDHFALPYADYFFAHPPLHLLPGMILFGLFGFGPVTARLIPIGATLIGATFLFLLAKRVLGRVGAGATVFFYLMAYSLLRASSHWTGINLSVMWIIIGLWAFYKDKPIVSGLAMAAGVCTQTYVVPAAVMLGMLAFVKSKSFGFRYWACLFGLWLIIQVICFVIGGESYWDSVYRYHLNKKTSPGSAWKMSIRVFSDNYALFISVILGLAISSTKKVFKGKSVKDVLLHNPEGLAWAAIVLVSSDNFVLFISMLLAVVVSSAKKVFKGMSLRDLLLLDADSLARVGVLWIIGYMIFISLLAKVFPFYFLLMFPAMALCGGYVVSRLADTSVQLVENRKERTLRWYKKAVTISVMLVAVIIAFVVHIPVQRSLLPQYVRSKDKPMKWADAPIPQFVNDGLRGCCWDDLAKAYQPYGTIQEYLYHESRYFEKAESLAEYVKNITRPDQTIFGDSPVAGIVALLAGRRLAADVADTNTNRFSSGLTSPDELIEKIDAPDLAYVVASGRPLRKDADISQVRFMRVAGVEAFSHWLKTNFKVAYRVYDRTKGWFFLLEKK
jgi:hypothetical protein